MSFKLENQLSDDERKILTAARKGYLAKFPADPKPKIDAAFLVHILSGKYGEIDPKGLQITGIDVAGSFDLQNRKVEPRIYFENCDFPQQINLRDARLSGLFLPGCMVAKGIRADRLKVTGSVHLNNKFTAKGEVRLLGAEIGGALECSLGSFEATGNALTADHMTVTGSVHLNNNFTAKGEVSLLGTEIGGDLDCSNGQFEGATVSLSAERLQASGNVLMRKGFTAKSNISLISAKLGQVFSMMGEGISGTLDLRHAETVSLYDDEAAWPESGKLRLDGFQYERFFGKSPIDYDSRKRWLKLQATKDYTPQPYEQLAKVYKAVGHNREARLTLMEKEREYRRKAKLGVGRWLWNVISGFTVGYGYAPWRAAYWLIGLWLLGCAVFWQAKTHGLMVPTKERVYMSVKCPASEALNCPQSISGKADVNLENLRISYPRLNPLMYSLDALLPFVDFKQEDYWLPSTGGTNRTYGLWVRTYLWIHIILGWFLASMGVAGITGLVKKDN